MIGLLILLAILMWFEIGLLVGASIATGAWPLALAGLAITLWAIRRME